MLITKMIFTVGRGGAWESIILEEDQKYLKQTNKTYSEETLL